MTDRQPNSHERMDENDAVTESEQMPGDDVETLNEWLIECNEGKEGALYSTKPKK